jgi:hypothetical protein
MTQALYAHMNNKRKKNKVDMQLIKWFLVCSALCTYHHSQLGTISSVPQKQLSSCHRLPVSVDASLLGTSCK